MEGILKVTPENLVQTSGEFAAMGGQIKNLTGEMNTLVQGLSGIWQGEASVAYGNKFKSLQTDMDKLDRMVHEHVEDLQEMARQYQTAERGNSEESSRLVSNVIL